MNPRPVVSLPLALPALLFVLPAFLISSARAGDGTWKANATGVWSDALNWVGSVADGADAIAYFDSVNVTADRTVNLNSARTIGGLVFGDTDTSSAAGWILANNSEAANILTLDVATGSPTITVNALGTAKAATISAVIAGTDGLSKAGAGTLILSGTNTFTGDISVSAGRLQVGNDAHLGNAANNITLTNGASLYYSTDAGTFGSSRTLTLGTGGGTVGSAAYSAINVAAALSGSGLLSISASNSGVNLTGNNSAHTGGITVNNGRLQFSNLAALPTTGSIAINAGGSLVANSIGTLTSVNAWLSSGRITSDSTGGILLTASSAQTIDLSGYASLMLGSGTEGANFTGTLTPAGTTYRLGGGGNGNTNSRLVIAGTNILTGTRDVVIGNGTAGTTGMGISAAQDYTGGTTITQGARLVVAHSNALGSGAVNNTNGEVLLRGGVTVANTLNITSSVDSSNIEETLRSNSGENTWSGTINLLSGSKFYTDNVAGNKLTVSGDVNLGAFGLSVIAASGSTTTATGGDVVISGNIGGTAGLTKTNTAGSLTLTGTNSYGSTTNSGGALRIGNGGLTGTLGTGNVSNTGSLIFNRSNTYALTNVISGTGTLTQAGSGLLNLKGVNTYTGATTVSAGTLLVDGSLSNSSAVTVDSGGRIGGLGSVGAVTFNTGAGLAYDLASASQSGDGLTATSFTGTGLGSFTLYLTGAGSGFDATQSYSWAVLSSSSVSSITLTNITLDTNGFGQAVSGSFNLSKDATSLFVNYVGAPIPEPSTYALIAGGALLVFVTVRRLRRSRV